MVLVVLPPADVVNTVLPEIDVRAAIVPVTDPEPLADPSQSVIPSSPAPVIVDVIVFPDERTVPQYMTPSS
jgi:hypothetical protein